MRGFPEEIEREDEMKRGHSRFWLMAGGLALAVLAAGGAELGAQERPVLFGVGGGVAFPLGEIADEFDAGLHANVFLQTGTLGALPVALRAEGGIQRLSRDDDSLRNLAARVNAVLPFATRPDAAPYLIAGVGLYNTKEEVGDHGSGDHAESENFLGVNVGVGVRWSLGGLRTFVEARYHSVFDDVHTQHIIPLTIGITF